MSRTSLLGLDPATYQRHFLHGDDRAWTETNCYVDLWIELLHGWGLDPVPTLSFIAGLDWEGDGFTFVKPWLEDIWELYGLDTMEHNPWKPLEQTIQEQLARGRSVIVECDSFHLPDTAGVAYQLEHVKSSVACEAIDLEARTLRYFHGRSYYEVSGDDFAGALRLSSPPGAVNLPPYFEIVKADHLRRPAPAELKAISLRHLRKHLARAPKENPVRSFARDFGRDLAWLKSQPIATFHLYSFASIRQLGSACECAASYVKWLASLGEGGLDASAAAFDAVSSSAKAMQFRLARASSTKKPWDPAPSLQAMAEAWDAAVGPLRAVGS